MARKTFVVAAVTASALGILVLSACSPKGNAGSATPAGASDAARVQQSTGVTKLATAQVEGIGQVITDQNGLTLYRFDRDSSKPPASHCTGDCATTWPSVLSDANLQVQGVDKAMVGKVKRPDGTEQVTVGGWPVYHYAIDTQAGEAKGHGLSGAWFAVNPQGGKAIRSGASDNSGNSTAAAPKTIRLVAGNVDGIGPAITDQNGMTLYLFSKDSKKPSKSTCNDACAANWPPVMDNGNVQLQGIDKKLLGRVKRADGTMQVTVGGWPVYRFSKDGKPGDAKGHGVQGTWFVIEPAGCKSATPPPADPPAAASGNEASPPGGGLGSSDGY
jgi:predicted lipoprotein with Yx(FWY)xxD motif